MTILEDIEKTFGTSNLYEVLGVKKGASHDQIKKAYRRMSLKVHPDRVSDSQKEEFTKKFQTLAQVHYVLSDDERRKMYDEHGIIMNEDSLSGEADWEKYWRLLFPKVTVKDIENFVDKYRGTQEEKDDLIKIFNQHKGDMDKISQCHIGFEEDRTRALIESMIESGELTAYDKFVNEPESKREKRRKQAIKEAKRAEKAKKNAEKGPSDGDMDNLVALIAGKREDRFSSLMSSLEAKYAKPEPKGMKRKRSDK